jgi:pyruvate dehydrogenase E1 component alpha subunit
MGTALSRHAADPDLSKRPAAFGIPAQRVDGMDVRAVEAAARTAVDAIRRGGGPRFLELLTYRFRAHSMYDPDKYRDKAEVERWKRRDPIALFETRLREEGLLAADEMAGIERRADDEVEGAVRAAEAAPLEPVEELTRHVYAQEIQ